MNNDELSQFLNENFSDTKYIQSAINIANREGADKVFQSLNNSISKSRQFKQKGGLLGGGLNSNLFSGEQSFSSDGEDIINSIYKDYTGNKTTSSFIEPQLYSQDTRGELGQSPLRAFTNSVVRANPYLNLASTPGSLKRLEKSAKDWIGLGVDDLTGLVPDPNFNKDQYVKDNNISTEDLPYYDSVTSQQEADKLTNWISNRDKEFQEDSYFWGAQLAGSFTGVTLDPLTYAFPTLKTESLLARVSAAALGSGAITTVQEGLMHEADPTRSYEESLINIAASSIIAGAIGSQLRAAKNIDEQQQIANEARVKYGGKVTTAFQDVIRGNIKKETVVAADLSDLTSVNPAIYSSGDEGNIVSDALMYLNSKTNVTGSLDQSMFNSAKEASRKNTLHILPRQDGITEETPASLQRLSQHNQAQIAIRDSLDAINSSVSKGYDEAIVTDYMFKVAEDPAKIVLVPDNIKAEVQAAAASYRKPLDEYYQAGIKEDLGIYPKYNVWNEKFGYNYVSKQINKDLRYDPTVRDNLGNMIDERTKQSLNALDNEQFIQDTKQAMFDLDERRFLGSKMLPYDNIRLSDKIIWEKALNEIEVSKYANDALRTVIKEFDLKAIKGILQDDFKLVVDKVLDNLRNELRSYHKSPTENKIDDLFDTGGGDIELNITGNNINNIKSLARNRRLYTYSDVAIATNKGVKGSLERAASDFAMAKGFKENYGTHDPRIAFQNTTKEILKEAEDLKKNLNKSAADYQSKALAIDDAARRDIEDLKTQFQMVLGTYARDGDYSQPIYRHLRIFKTGYQTPVRMGASTLSMIPEVSAALYKDYMVGKVPELKSLGLLMKDVKKMSPEDLASIGIGATEMTQNNVLKTNIQALDPRGGLASKGETWANKVSALMFKTILFGKADDFIRRTLTHAGFNAHLPAMDRFMLGTATAEDKLLLSRAGLNKKKIEAIFRNIKTHSTLDEDGLRHFNEAKWDKEGRDACSFLFREVAKVSAVGLAEHQPQWLSTQLGSVLFAFQSYSWSNQMQRVMYNAYNLNSKRAEVVANIMISLMGAAVAVMARNTIKGKETNWERLPLDAVMYSGVLGTPADLSMLGVNTFLGGHQDALVRGSIPLYGTVGQLQAAGRVLTGSRTENDINKTIGLTGLGTWMYTSGIMNQLAKELSTTEK